MTDPTSYAAPPVSALERDSGTLAGQMLQLMHEIEDEREQWSRRISAAEAKCRELEGEVARADARAGKAERLLEDLRDQERKRDQWLRDAKIMRGYGQNTPFDEVWEKTCIAADSAGQAKERADRLTTAAQAARDALEPFASGGDWGSVKAWIIAGASDKAKGLAAAKDITKWQAASDKALASLVAVLPTLAKEEGSASQERENG